MTASPKNCKILITGASGLVGHHAARLLKERGWDLVVLGRGSEADFRRRFTIPCAYFQWIDPEITPPPRAALQVNAVLNLMGENLASQRWTEELKKKFHSSRVLGTRNLVRALKEHGAEVKTFVSASAVGVYGDRGEEILTEASALGEDFLARLCKDWEAEASAANARVVCLRIGMILAAEGGALDKMLPIFRMGLGGKIGSGEQWQSWIHVEDLARMIVAALDDENWRGPVNAVSPGAVTNTEFTQALASVLGRWAPFPVPKFALQAALGGMSAVVLSSQHVRPEAALRMGFEFRFPSISSALAALFGKKPQ